MTQAQLQWNAPVGAPVALQQQWVLVVDGRALGLCGQPIRFDHAAANEDLLVAGFKALQFYGIEAESLTIARQQPD